MSPSPNQQDGSAPSTGAVSTPVKWPKREHFQETVTLIVGTEKKPYTVHKDLLCFYSDYFRAAFQGSFKEAAERKIDLLGVQEDVFEHFQVWLYTRRLDFATLSFKAIVELWVFGDQHQIPLLQNYTVDGLFDKRVKENGFPTSAIPFVYDNTPTGSALRRAVIEIASSLALQDPERTTLSPDRWSVESLIDLVRVIDARPRDLGKTNIVEISKKINNTMETFLTPVRYDQALSNESEAHLAFSKSNI
ncbi:hypothetical protein KCU67_g5806, partial [Aureobasidium melanogenum]